MSRPKAAPPVFPLPGHRSMAQVMEREAINARAREANRLEREFGPVREPVTDPLDYGSPFAVRRAE